MKHKSTLGLLCSLVVFSSLTQNTAQASGDPVLDHYKVQVNSSEAALCQLAFILGTGAAIGAGLASLTGVPGPSIVYAFDFKSLMPFSGLREPAPTNWPAVIGAGALIGTLVAARVLETAGPPDRSTRWYIGAVQYALEPTLPIPKAFEVFFNRVVEQGSERSSELQSKVAEGLLEFHRTLDANNLPKRPFRLAVTFVSQKLGN